MAFVHDIACPKQRGADGQVGSVISPIIDRNLRPLGFIPRTLEAISSVSGNIRGWPDRRVLPVHNPQSNSIGSLDWSVKKVD